MQFQQPLNELSPMGAAYHLEQLYDFIRTDRMAGIPILNDNINVQAVGFRAWEGHVLGVLITPWFMNLMLLPGEQDDWSGYQIGSKHLFSFKAGSFEFIVGEEPGLGHYMSCSMFSPMFEFENHDAATITAEAIIPGLFNEEHQEPSEFRQAMDDSVQENTMEQQQRGVEKSLPLTVLEGVQVITEATQKNLDKPLSRRELLRGSFFRMNKKEQGGS